MTGAMCLFCGGDASADGHMARCDGRQGRVEAAFAPTWDDRPNPPRRPTLAASEAGTAVVAYQAQAEAFHAANPHIFDTLKRLALDARQRRKRFGIRTLWERMRWIRELETHDDASDLKLNDHYHAFYARLLMADVPELVGFFELRESRKALRHD